MKKTILLHLLFYIMIACSTPPDDRTQLEQAYKDFLQAMKSKDAEKLKSTLSSFAYMDIKNKMTSFGSPFPESFYEASAELQDIEKLTFQKVIINGPTANSIYTGKDQSGEEGIFIFSFHREAAKWKFNLSQYYSSDSIRNGIATGNLSFLSGKEYQPDGILPPVPAEIKLSDYKAMLDITAYNYEVEVTVNGNVQPKTTGGSRSGLLLGGLQKGVNHISITAKPIKEEQPPSTIDVKIRAIINGEEKEVLTIEDGSAESPITKDFTIE